MTTVTTVTTARLEPWKGRWRVVLTRDGRQEVLRSGLSRTQAERIAEAMCPSAATVQTCGRRSERQGEATTIIIRRKAQK